MNPFNRGPIRKFNDWFDRINEPFRFLFFLVVIMGWAFLPVTVDSPVWLKTLLLSWIGMVAVLAISRIPRQ